MENVKCEECGIEFEVYPYRSDSASYCSKSCKNEAAKDRVERECDECGSTVIRVPSQDELSPLTFCDRDCKFDYFSGERNPNWNGGSGTRYYGKDWEEQRKKAIERDNYTCQICGDKESLLHVHHRNPFNDFDDHTEANELSNLKTLCAKCHGELECGPTIDRVISAAEEVHKHLGEGHTESTYHSALGNELSNRQISFTSEGTIPILYKGNPVGKRRPDIFITDSDETIVVELKAGSDRGESQMLNYVDILEGDKNFDISGGLLLQFNDDLSVTKS